MKIIHGARQSPAGGSPVSIFVKPRAILELKSNCSHCHRHGNAFGGHLFPSMYLSRASAIDTYMQVILKCSALFLRYLLRMTPGKLAGEIGNRK